MNNNLPSEAVAHAVAVLKNEHVIAYPTEAVFGVGCDPDSETAVMRLLELKQRPVEKGLILIAASFEQLKPYIDDSRLSDSQREAIFSCWPGPVTFVFPARPETPRWLTGRFDSLAVRVTNHPLVIELCEAYGKPLVSTSPISRPISRIPKARLPVASRLRQRNASKTVLFISPSGNVFSTLSVRGEGEEKYCRQRRV